MTTNNPFGMEIDDDGLPKYSPDRNNITAYHMYKLGMTDKLPDPEESHTPFFRTPSWYEEKAQRERQEQADSNPKFEKMPPRPDFYKRRPMGVGTEGVNPHAIRQKSLVPDTRDPYGQMGQAGQKEKGSPLGLQVEKGQNIEAVSLDGNAFGRKVLERIFTEVKPVVHNGGSDGRWQKQPFSGTGRTGWPQQYTHPKEPVSPEKPDTSEKGFDLSGQIPPSASRTLPFELNRPMPLLVQTDESGNNTSLPLADEALRAIQGESDMPDRSTQVADLRNSFAWRTLELIFNSRDKDEDPDRSEVSPLLFRPEEPLGNGHSTGPENGAVRLNDIKAMPVQDAFYPAKEEAPVHHAADSGNETARGWMNEDTSQSGSQQAADALQDGEFDPDGLEPPSAGRPLNKPFRSVFANDNAANPGFVPLQVALLSPGQLPIPKGRREVSIEMTHDINSRLTRLNRGWPIGINFTVLSRLEGGSSAYANLPIAGKELDLERREKMEAMKRGVPPPQRKWANNSGVTIGSGFDLGQTSADEMRGMGFDESFIQKCAPYIGKKRVAADDELRKRPLVLTDKEIDQVNDIVMMDKAQKSIQDWDSRIARLKKTMPNAPFFHEMNSAQQTIVFSRYYHQGPGWIGRTANRPMFEAMKRNDWAMVKRQLEGLVNSSGPRWLKDRFWKELEFLSGKYNKH